MDKKTEALSNLGKLEKEHDNVGKQVFTLADGKIFPCDLLYISVINRSLELLDGFSLLASEGKYGCCMALTRLQLDNVLRFYGVLLTEDPHDTAHKVFDGTKLSKIKGKEGKKLQDFYLVEKLSKNNPWIYNVYKLCSGYIHLSENHILHMIEQTTKSDDGKRKFYIGSNNGKIEEQQWEELINAFSVITEAIFKLFLVWEQRAKLYDQSVLEEKYEKAEF